MDVFNLRSLFGEVPKDLGVECAMVRKVYRGSTSLNSGRFGANDTADEIATG